MATIYRCDRCRKEVKGQLDLYTMQRLSVGDKVPMADVTHEICTACATQIMREWNDSLPEEEPRAY